MPFCLAAQVMPGEGNALNYRIIGFSFPGRAHIAEYKVQIAPGNYKNEDSFQKNIAITITSKKNRLIAEVPSFGKQYTWRQVYIDNKAKTLTGGLHHFSTLMSPEVDPDSTRCRLTQPSQQYKDYYFFVDGNKVLYDMSGNPVWFFPEIDSTDPASMHLRDLKITPLGTITTIADERIYEINYDGDVLWRGPDNNKISTSKFSQEDAYHHEFTRLANGHYMVMGFEQPWWQLPYKIDSFTVSVLGDKIKKDSNGTLYQKMFLGTILEYDTQGHVVWQWSSADYFQHSDLAHRMTGNGLFNLNNTHANAFYFDEKNQAIYISFRDLNRIIKIRYPDGKVLGTYGTLYKSSESRQNRHLVNGVFCGQHSCRLTSDDYLYLFNNNVCERFHAPTIIMLKEPAPGRDTLIKVWEFECPLNELTEQQKTTIAFNFGGNVLELPGKAFFVCTGGTYGKLFIVNRDKKVLWSAQPEKWDAYKKAWNTEGVIMSNQMREGCYRASIINRKQLEHLIWHEPMDK